MSNILECFSFSYYYAIWKLRIEIEDDQAKYFIMLVGLEFVIERESIAGREPTAEMSL